MEQSRQKFNSGWGQKLFLGAVGLVFLLSALPLIGSVGQPWPGFFYSPFYTSNIFSDSTLPASEAGLRPEDRVIQAAVLPEKWQRIDKLAEQSELALASNRPLTLLYELGRDIVTIPVKVERLDGWVLLEKAGPLFLTGLALAYLVFSRPGAPLAWRLFAGCAALALLAAPDYFLNSGQGRESGFLPGATGWLEASAKWSAFIYAPLWKVAVAAGASLAISGGTLACRGDFKDLSSKLSTTAPKGEVDLEGATGHSPRGGRAPLRVCYARGVPHLTPPLPATPKGAGVLNLQLFRRQFSKYRRPGGLGRNLIVAGLLFDLVTYGYEVTRTATYNNPDYVVWQVRGAFWLEWLGLALLLGLNQLRRTSGLALAGFIIFLVGFVVPTTFDLAWPGPGPQWYSLGLLLYFSATPPKADKYGLA